MRTFVITDHNKQFIVNLIQNNEHLQTNPERYKNEDKRFKYIYIYE